MSKIRTYRHQAISRSQVQRIADLMDAFGERHATLIILTGEGEDDKGEALPASSVDVALSIGDAVRGATIQPSGLVVAGDPERAAR